MKSRTLQSIVPVLLLISCTPALCRAQAEINPDHFESLSSTSKFSSKTTSNRNPSQAYGGFLLPVAVRCGGVELTPGYYSLSIRQSGRKNVVRLMPMVISARAHALELTLTPRLSAETPSGLLVDRSNQGRTLRAISLGQPGVILFVQASQQIGLSTTTEFIPVSTSTTGALLASGN